MRKVLTGVSNNVGKHIDKIKVWAHSFEKHTDGDAVLIGADMTEDDKLSLKSNNICSLSVFQSMRCLICLLGILITPKKGSYD